MLYTETVSEELLNLLKELMQLPKLKAFRLVGGTAMSLQCGHRSSVDIDLFTEHSFPISDLTVELITRFNGKELVRSSQGVAMSMGEIKVDLYNWAVPFIDGACGNRRIKVGLVKRYCCLQVRHHLHKEREKGFF